MSLVHSCCCLPLLAFFSAFHLYIPSVDRTHCFWCHLLEFSAVKSHFVGLALKTECDIMMPVRFTERSSEQMRVMGAAEDKSKLKWNTNDWSSFQPHLGMCAEMFQPPEHLIWISSSLWGLLESQKSSSSDWKFPLKKTRIPVEACKTRTGRTLSHQQAFHIFNRHWPFAWLTLIFFSKCTDVSPSLEKCKHFSLAVFRLIIVLNLRYTFHGLQQ